MREGLLVAAAALALGGCAMVRTPYVVAVEHELRPSEQTAPPEVQLDPQYMIVGPGQLAPSAGAGAAAGAYAAGDVWAQFREPVWDWPVLHLQQSADFPDPLLGNEVYPEVAIGSSVVAAHVEERDRFEMQSRLNISLYWLDLSFPVIDTVDGARPEPLLNLSLKIPFAWPGAERHWLAPLWGATIGNGTPQLADSSRFELLYGYGGKLLELQLHAGYGYTQIFTDPQVRQGLLYGGLLGLSLGKVRPQIEVQGIQFVTNDAQVSLVPGVRLLPASLPTLQLQVAGLVVLTGGNDSPGNRYGAVFEISYNFL
jgi:hypothetical protein